MHMHAHTHTHVLVKICFKHKWLNASDGSGLVSTISQWFALEPVDERSPLHIQTLGEEEKKGSVPEWPKFCLQILFKKPLISPCISLIR